VDRISGSGFFIMQTECVYCAVRNGSLNIIQIKLSLKYRPLAQTVSLRFPEVGV
jgi:hypothetical protein